MKVFSTCNQCGESFTLLLDKQENSFLEHIKEDGGTTCPCPRICGGKINLVNIRPASEAPAHPGATITGKQLYLAVCGMGLPDEIQTDQVVVDALLRSSRIVHAITEQPDKGGRLYLHELILDNGTTIHLSAGPRGACVLKITKDRSCQPGSSQKA